MLVYRSSLSSPEGRHDKGSIYRCWDSVRGRRGGQSTDAEIPSVVEGVDNLQMLKCHPLVDGVGSAKLRPREHFVI